MQECSVSNISVVVKAILAQKKQPFFKQNDMFKIVLLDIKIYCVQRLKLLKQLTNKDGKSDYSLSQLNICQYFTSYIGQI